MEVFDDVEEEDDEDDGEAEDGDGQNWAFFTFEILVNTLNGVTFPITVTFFVSKSMLYDVTPAKKPIHYFLNLCFFKHDILIYGASSLLLKIIYEIKEQMGNSQSESFLTLD